MEENKIKRMKKLVESMEEYENSFFHFEEDAGIYECDKEELFELIKSL